MNEPRIFLCRLVTEVPLPSVEEEEIYAAAMQNAICEYGWYDWRPGDFQKVAEDPTTAPSSPTVPSAGGSSRAWPGGGSILSGGWWMKRA